MHSDSDIRTSATLLKQLRVLEDQQAWNRFMDLYSPLLRVWGARAGLPHHDVEDLISRLLVKLVQEIPRFVYDPRRGRFRSWLKALTNHELVNMAREAAHRLPGDKGTGRSTIHDLLIQHPDTLDELVDGLHQCSINMLEVLHEAINEERDACQGDERISWEIFNRTILMREKIRLVAQEFHLTYHAAAMRVQRIKPRIGARAIRLFRERANIEAANEEKPQN